jgi:TonB family protein
VSGEVTLRFDVDADGRPTEITVVRSEPAGVFDAVAISALEQWRYCPPEAKGYEIDFGFEP